MKLWQKKNQPAEGEAAKRAETFTVGNDFLLDQKLIPYDIKASKVHAESLEEAGILTSEESSLLCKGLDEILEKWRSGNFGILPEQEDGHTAIEAYLTKKMGETGKKIHTGRSRNDQVLTAMRLYELEMIMKTGNLLHKFTDSLLNFAETNRDVPLPGFTHTRKAMLSGVAQWAAGYAELLLVLREQGQAVKKMISRSPLGTAAGFGSTINLDREAQAKALGFDTVLISATSAQLSRGWMEWQLVNWLSGISSLTARMASDAIRYSSESHGFFDLDSAVCTGSSIMPQKKNPDVAELIRGRHAVVAGQAAILQNLVTNLESGYHRDLQLTKEPVITAFETVVEILNASCLLISSCEINPEKINVAITPELFEAEAANLLVLDDGMSFRDAYRKVTANPELSIKISLSDLMKRYTQTGSPGYPGIERLRAWNDSGDL